MTTNSIRKIMPPRKRRNARTKATERDRKVRLFNDLLNGYMFRLAKRAGISPRAPMAEVVSKLAGKTLSYLDAWEWLAEAYDKDPTREPWEWHDKAIAELRAGLRRQKREAAVRHDEQVARQAALAAQQLPGAEFYQSLAWRQLRYQVLKDRGDTCEACKRTAAKHGVAIHVDHILPRSEFPDLALEITNLQVLCDDCNIGKGTGDQTDWRVA